MPTPEGPDSTIGRLSLGIGGVDAQLDDGMLAVDAKGNLLTAAKKEEDGKQVPEAERKGVMQRIIRILKASLI